MKPFLAIFAFFFFLPFSNAQQLVYTPTNPAFGGNTFNHQWLMSSAQAQNEYQKDREDQFGSLTSDGLSQIGRNLNNQLVNNLTSTLFDGAFGEDGIQPGNYNFGNLNLNVTPSTQGLSVKIIDINTGETTTIVVPFY